MFPSLVLSLGLLIGQVETPLLENAPAEIPPSAAAEEPGRFPESLK